MTTPAPNAGLEDVVVSTSEICFIDGDQGRLLYRGYDIHDLVAHASFEETAFLLWFGHLPSRKELDAFQKALVKERRLGPNAQSIGKDLARSATVGDFAQPIILQPRRG